MKFLKLVAILLTLSSCSSNDKEIISTETKPFSQIVLSNSSGISYEYNNAVTLQFLSERATIHCSAEGKRPILNNNSKLDNGNQVATFMCQ